MVGLASPSHHPHLLTPSSEHFPTSNVTSWARLEGQQTVLFTPGAGGSVDIAQGWTVWGPVVEALMVLPPTAPAGRRS